MIFARPEQSAARFRLGVSAGVSTRQPGCLDRIRPRQYLAGAATSAPQLRTGPNLPRPTRFAGPPEPQSQQHVSCTGNPARFLFLRARTGGPHRRAAGPISTKEHDNGTLEPQEAAREGHQVSRESQEGAGEEGREGQSAVSGVTIADWLQGVAIALVIVAGLAIVSVVIAEFA